MVLSQQALAQAEEPTVALVQINQQALFFNQMNEGATAAAEQAGANLVIFNANNDPAAQNNAIETYIAAGRRCDHRRRDQRQWHHAQPWNGGRMPRQASPCFAVDAILPDGPHKSQIGVDNEGAGAEIGQAFLDLRRQGDGRLRPRSALSAR